jgi:hypothetical protein
VSDSRASFGVSSSAYASDRPHYPSELFAWVASMCADRRTAWDCGTGNGQAATGLAPWFDRVEATDIASAQVAQGFSAPNVRYSAQPAERTNFPESHFDLVAIAQALHWFDLKRFWPEVRRVAYPGAFFCAWGYAWFEQTPELQELNAVYLERLLPRLEPYWARENRILWNGYVKAEIALPFEHLEAPQFAIRLEWDIERVIRYVRTWSAYKAALTDPKAATAIARLEDEARARLDACGPLPLSLPLTIVAAAIV